MKEEEKEIVRSMINEYRGYAGVYDIQTMTASDHERALALETLLEEVEYGEEEG